MMMLVLVSLGATLAAIGGFGNTPIRNSNGIRPCMGVNCGHPARTPGTGGADRKPKIRPAPTAPTTSAMISMDRAFTTIVGR
jgi:hypothetical protein